eukprot:1155000-Pelagomonas_calceolata.AAC.4
MDQSSGVGYGFEAKASGKWDMGKSVLQKAGHPHSSALTSAKWILRSSAAARLQWQVFGAHTLQQLQKHSVTHNLTSNYW